MTSPGSSTPSSTKTTGTPASITSKFVIALILVVGVGLGYGLGYGSGGKLSQTDTDEINKMIRTYIADNPGFVLEVLTNYNQQQRDAARHICTAEGKPDLTLIDLFF